MMRGEAELGCLDTLGGEVYSTKREDGREGARHGCSGRGNLTAAELYGQSIAGEGYLTILGGLTSQLEGICKGFLMASDKLC